MAGEMASLRSKPSRHVSNSDASGACDETIFGEGEACHLAVNTVVWPPLSVAANNAATSRKSSWQAVITAVLNDIPDDNRNPTRRCRSRIHVQVFSWADDQNAIQPSRFRPSRLDMPGLASDGVCNVPFAMLNI